MLSQSGFFCRQDFKFNLPLRDGCFFASELALISSRKPLCKGRSQHRKEQPTVFDALSQLGRDLRLHDCLSPHLRASQQQMHDTRASSTKSRCFHGAHNNNTFCASCPKNEPCYGSTSVLSQHDGLVESLFMSLDRPSQDLIGNCRRSTHQLLVKVTKNLSQEK